MAISSFLTEGAAIPQGSAVTDMTKQTILPDFYTNYAQEILSGQKALANRPFTTAPMPRVAGFTPAQLEAFQKTGVAADAYKPLLGEATTAAQGAANAPGALETAQPYLGAAGQTSVANIGQYMNPYTDAVVNALGHDDGHGTRRARHQRRHPWTANSRFAERLHTGRRAGRHRPVAHGPAGWHGR